MSVILNVNTTFESAEMRTLMHGLIDHENDPIITGRIDDANTR